MAGKSLLCHLGKRRKSYKVNLLQSQGCSLSCSINGQMAGRYSSSSSNSTSATGDAPPPKKRKTGDDEEEWDDLEFTQADLEDLEIQASQAYAGSSSSHRPDTTLRAEPQPSTSRGHVRTETDAQGTFVAPLVSRHSSTSSSGGRVGNSSHSSNQSHAANNSRASNLLNRTSSSSSSYPSSLSGYEGNRSSASLSSGSSGEIALAQRRASLTHGISSDSSYSMDVSRILGREQSVNQSAAQDDTQRVKQECQALKLQLEKMKDDLSIKEGEIKLLRENLTRREADLDRLKSEKINQIVQQNKQQTDKEKALQVEVERLQTKLQFSEEEKRELGNRCRDLEGQVKNTQGGPSSSQLNQTQTSPRPRRVLVEDRESPKSSTRESPKSSTSFPTKATFHAPEGSPKRQAKGDHPVQDTATMTSIRMNRRQYRLNVSSNLAVSGSRLVARLLDITPSSAGSLSERGIVGLLHTPSASTSAQSVSFDRDRETSLLSPCRRRVSDVQSLLEAQEKPETSSIVSLDHFNMAVHGLTQLLREDVSNLTMTLPPAVETMDTSERSTFTSDENMLDHAVLILPLLNDYLSHYINMLESSTETLITSPATASSSSGSYDSSVDSSLGLLLKDSATYANNLENLALASLRTLHILTNCHSVRTMLLYCQPVEEVSDSSGSNKSEKASTSGCDRNKREEPGSRGRTKFQHLPKKYIEDLHLLQKVVKLADPGSKGHLFSVEIVEASLSILSALAQTSSEEHIQSLMAVVSEEVVHNCIECESEPSIICGCLELLRSLVRSNAIVSGLCMKASECVLLCLYNFCSSEGILAKFPHKTVLQIFHLIVKCLSSIVGLHKGGLTVLLESDCECSVQVVPSLIVLLYNVVKLYKEQNDDISFPILQSGVYLLHQMYQHELNFTRRHIAVQSQYVVLISHLNRIFKTAGAEQYDNEISALQDLWDFSPDEEDYESSHDRSHDSNDDEENMETG